MTPISRLDIGPYHSAALIWGKAGRDSRDGFSPIAFPVSFRDLMHWPLLILLLAACVLLMLLERLGVPTTLALNFKGDVKRETRWLAQYGQSVCTPVAALLIYQLDPSAPAVRLRRAIVLIVAVSVASILSMLL